MERRILGARFALGDVIGTGTMGIVYEAEDLSDGRTVAVKVLSPNRRGDPALEERLRREARAAAAVRHPNIVRIVAVGAVEGGSAGATTFVAMERLRGENLAELVVRRGQLSIDKAAQIAADVLAGLDAAHVRRVVHRDIKPANVHRTLDRVVKILDFGLSVRRGRRGFGATPEGAAAGSPPYMAPEQLAPHDEGVDPVDARADLYAVGALLYEMLTGVPPFRAAELTEVIRQVLHDAPVPPRERRSEVPASLESLVLRALSKSRDDRFASAVAMAETLADSVG